MRIATYFSKRTWLAAIATGVGVAAFAWYILLPIPRSTIAVRAHPGVVLSNNARYCIVVPAGSGVMQLWDVLENRVLIQTELHEKVLLANDGRIARFTRDQKQVVILNHDELSVFDLSRQEYCAIEQPKLLKREKRNGSTQLINDFEGNVLFMTHDSRASKVTFREWESDKIISVWNTASGLLSRINENGVILFERQTRDVKLLEVPSGKVLNVMKRQPDDDSKNRNPSHWVHTMDLTATSDCRTLAYSNRNVRSYLDSVETKHDIKHGHMPAISPDGRPLAWHIHHADHPMSWIDQARTWLRMESYFSDICVYDLADRQIIETFPNGHVAKFSGDGKTLMILYVGANRIDFHDLPLRRPWLNIVGVGVLATALVLGVAMFGKWRRGNQPAQAPSPPASL